MADCKNGYTQACTHEAAQLRTIVAQEFEAAMEIIKIGNYMEYAFLNAEARTSQTHVIDVRVPHTDIIWWVSMNHSQNKEKRIAVIIIKKRWKRQ